MHENFPQQEYKKDITPQDQLKQDFLNDKINLEQFRDRYFEIEGMGTHVENSEANIGLLEDKEVHEKILNFGQEYGKEGRELLSAKINSWLGFSYFHKGQKDISYDDFKKSHQLVQNSWYVLETKEFSENKKLILDSDFLKHNEWLKYIEGTLAYLESNKTTLNERINEITEINQQIIEIGERIGEKINSKDLESNLNVLKRFLESLENGENPRENYYKRYNSPEQNNYETNTD